MRSISFEGQDLYYHIEGEGIPVLLLHGFLENQSIWDNIKPSIIASGCRVITVDLPCHGKSRFDGEICTMEFMAEGILKVLSHEKIENPFLFGHSMGGYVGLELIKRIPVGLTLLHSNFWADSENKKHDRNRVIEVVTHSKKRFIREAIPNLFAPENRSKNEQDIETLISGACEIPIREIQASTAGMRDRNDNTVLLDEHNIYIIHGEEDPIIPSELLLSELKKVSKDIQLFTIKNCGHMSVWESPETLIKLMKSVISP